MDITEDGKWIYEDQNGNAVESKDVKIEDRKVIGNGLPKHYLGWNNDFRYKNFDLSVTMRRSLWIPEYQLYSSAL